MTSSSEAKKTETPAPPITLRSVAVSKNIFPESVAK